MIAGLCGFADLLRQRGGAVGSAELIDAARALRLTDLADRRSVRQTLGLVISWSEVHPELFDQLFDEWFSGSDLDGIGLDPTAPDAGKDSPAIGLDADTAEAARLHADDAIAIEPRGEGDDRSAGNTADVGQPSRVPAPADPTTDAGQPVGASGKLAPAPPRDDERGHARHTVALVDLPDTPPPAELELARAALADAAERRRRADVVTPPRRVNAVAAPLTAAERAHLVRCVRRLNRQLDGAPAWRRTRRPQGAIDMRRTLRRTVTTGGRPIELRHSGRRDSAARLVVLVDLSMSVRGTARLVLHLMHRMRSMLGSLRAFGFVDSCVSIDRELRHADASIAIERVLGSVDLGASSDPGRALREWSARWSHLVTPATHVIILSDGRCNGRDPDLAVVERITRRSASTLWVSPEPAGAWTLGRGEMAAYSSRVDRAITVRSIDDLDLLATRPTQRAGVTPARRA